MIQITRDLARQLRVVLRKAGAGRLQRPIVELISDRGMLRIRAALHEVAIEHVQESSLAPESLLVPFEALADAEGKSRDAVTFTRAGDGVEATWDDGRIPKRKTYAIADSPPAFPVVEGEAKPVPGLFKALEHATQCSSRDHDRYTTQNIQLRGAKGEVVSTDGRQALVQSGFDFPWTEDLLVPSLALYGCRELALELPVMVSKGKTHVALQTAEHWTIYLAINTEGRFPDVARVLPKVDARVTTLRLGAQDAEFLARSLDKLPGHSDDQAPLTVDLHGVPTLRVKEPEQDQITEVVLSESHVAGAGVRWHTDRRFLARAASLGFSEITVVAADQPILCKDSSRNFVWVPLAKSLAIPPSSKAIRISTHGDSMDAVPPPPTQEPPAQERKTTAMSAVRQNGQAESNGQEEGHESSAKASQFAGLISEAQALKEHLREGYVRASRLIACLKRHRQKSKLLASTLSSLRQLQKIEA